MTFNYFRHIYLTVHKGKATATNLSNGESAIREMAKAEHPRSIMGSFSEVEAIFTEVIQKVCPNRFLLPAPIVYVHLLDNVEGGYTDVELRAFREAAYGAGAREVYLPSERYTLTRDQLINKRFTNWEHA
jgi:rod shape-determining protein MreB